MTKVRKITQAEARAFVQSLGMTFRKIERNEYRVAYHPSTMRDNEPSAYYTGDIEDAVDTAYAMAAHRDRIAAWARETVQCEAAARDAARAGAVALAVA